MTDLEKELEKKYLKECGKIGKLRTSLEEIRYKMARGYPMRNTILPMIEKLMQRIDE